jgi:molybdopterin-guanine dinucleotide biosynthesis protein A
MKPAALVLCGGRSRRMGRPKALLPFGPELLLQRVVRLVSEVCGPIVVVAAPEQDLPDLPADVSIARDPVSFRGPLQGLAVGMDALPSTVDLVYATATDVPFLVPAWISWLVEAMGAADVAIPDVEGYLHPLSALYRPASVRDAIAGLLAADRLRPVYLLESVQARVVTADEMRRADPRLDTLGNLNTPEDYRTALRRAGFDAPSGTGEAGTW